MALMMISSYSALIASPLGIKYIGKYCSRNMHSEVGLPPIRIHDLRHSHASFLINKGANIKAIASRLGSIM